MHRQIDWKTIKWSLAVGALAAVLFGCAGNSVGGGTTSTTASTSTTSSTGTTPFSNVASVNLPDVPASLQYVFLSGAGRAGDTETAVFRNLIATDIIGQSPSGLTQKTITLTSYQSQILSTNVDLASQHSRNFTTLQLNAISYTLTDSSGTQSFSDINNIPNDQAVSVRVFQGRQTQVPIYLDADTFGVETVNVGGVDTTQAAFDAGWFDTINRAQGDNVAIRGFLSDYMCFNVSGLSSSVLPTLSQGNGLATKVFFSGDGFAIGSGDPNNGGITGAPFELILPAGQEASVIGRYSTSASLGGVTTPGTYTTLGIDPSDVTTTDPVLARKITSFQGTWKFHFSEQLNTLNGQVVESGYLSNVHPFEAISIPTSLDDERQQLVMFSESISTNGNGTKTATITNLMWGYVDLSTKQLFIYPLKNINDTNTATNRDGEVVGTIGTMYTSSGAATLSPQQMRYASFSFSTPPAGFPATGTIVVLRKS